MKNTHFKVEDTIVDVISQDCIPPEQITKLITFLGNIK